MKLVTVHNRHNPSLFGELSKTAGTVVIEEPKLDDLLVALSSSIITLEPKTISLSVGAAFLHPKDQLNKKEGRKIALSRMKRLNFNVLFPDSILGNESTYFGLQAEDKEGKIFYEVAVKVYRKSRKLRVMNVSTREWKQYV